MENKLTIQQFAQLISSKKTGLAPTEVERVLKALFQDVSLQLQNVGEAEVPGLGVFKTVSKEKGSVILEVNPQLADMVNAPFQAFSVVELDDNYCEEENAEEEVPEIQAQETETEPEPEPVIELVPEPEPMVEPEVKSEEEVEVEPEVLKEDEDVEVVPPPVPDVDDNVGSEELPQEMETPPPFNRAMAYCESSRYELQPDEEEYVAEQKVSNGRKFVNGLICGVVISLGLAAIIAVICTVLL